MDRDLLRGLLRAFVARCAPVLAIAQPGVAVTVRAPVALPEGRLERTVARDHRAGVRTVTVGADPLEDDFGVLGQ